MQHQTVTLLRTFGAFSHWFCGKHCEKVLKSSKMNKATGRFNLRARKSMKLLGQKECNSCSRYYFPREYSDDEENIDSSNESEQICCNCEQKKQAKMKPTKKIHQNVASPKTIKIENVDPNEMDHNGPIQNKHNQNRGNNFRSDCMVQIHFDELTMQPTAMLDSNGELICIIWGNYGILSRFVS